MKSYHDDVEVGPWEPFGQACDKDGWDCKAEDYYEMH